MNSRHTEANKSLPRGIINLQDRYSSSIMDVSTRKVTAATAPVPPPNHSARVEKKRGEYHLQRSFSQGSSRRLLPASYFSLESLLLLVCLTASLLILPLILPPLPPPPFLLLLLPIGILVVLMILAFMPDMVVGSNGYGCWMPSGSDVLHDGYGLL